MIGHPRRCAGRRSLGVPLTSAPSCFCCLRPCPWRGGRRRRGCVRVFFDVDVDHVAGLGVLVASDPRPVARSSQESFPSPNRQRTLCTVDGGGPADTRSVLGPPPVRAQGNYPPLPPLRSFRGRQQEEVGAVGHRAVPVLAVMLCPPGRGRRRDLETLRGPTQRPPSSTMHRASCSRPFGARKALGWDPIDLRW